MISKITEQLDGYHAVYTDREGNHCKVKGTWALGAFLSWHDKNGNWMEIDGHDQGRYVDTSERIMQEYN